MRNNYKIQYADDSIMTISINLEQNKLVNISFNRFAQQYIIIQELNSDSIYNFDLVLHVKQNNHHFTLGDKEKLQSLFVKHNIKQKDLNLIADCIKEIVS